MRNGFKVQPRSDAELQLFLQIIDCFSGVYGFRQTMEPYISDTMRQEFVRRMSAKQDREIMDIKRRIQEGLLYPEFKHADLVTRPSYSPRKPYEVDLLYFVRQENPALLRKWFVDSVPQYFLTDLQIAHWTMLGREVFTPSELEEFIVWQKRLMHSQEMKVFAELVRVVSDIVVDEQRYKANKNRLYRQYTAIMAQPLLFLQFGEKHNELPFETTEPYLRVITERVVWQLTELQCFLIYCFGFFPSYLFNNPIKIQSAQYDEEPKREKTQGEMIDIMAQELIDLRPHTAYVKSAWKGKIQTVNVERAPELRLFAMNFTAWKNAIDKGILRPRSVIEEEIRERQENWRKRRGNEPPPPTHTGGNTPPSSGSAGNDREPPPTHSISEKPPEEKPAGSRDVSHQGTGAFTQPATEEKSMLSPPRTSLATTPSRQTPSVKLVYLRFFESGKGMPAREQRQYSTSFPQQTARFINFELHMVNLQYEQCDQSFQLLVHYYNPDGSLLREYQTEWVLPSSYKAFTYPYGWGEQELGYWKPGIYHVKILINGVEVADGSFTIKEDRDRVEHASASKKLPPSPALEFVSLRFFESVKGIPPDMWQRRYGTGFRQGTTRYINFDLTMRNGLYRQRNEKYLLNVRYYNPDGSLLIQGQEDILIRSDSGQLIYQYGQGWEEPGYWGPGTYRVEILIDGVKFAEGSFRIE